MKTTILLICLLMTSCKLLTPKATQPGPLSPIDIMIESQISQLTQQINV